MTPPIVKATAATILAMLALAPPHPAQAGGLWHKHRQLVAIPTQTVTPTAVAVQSAQVQVVQLAQPQAMVAAAPVQWQVITAQPAHAPQAQASPAPPPTINITVVEADVPSLQSSPTPTGQARAVPQVQASPAPTIAYQAIPQTFAYTIQPQAAPVSPAVPMHLYYLTPAHSCNLFCRH